LREDLVRCSRHGYNFESIWLNVCEGKVEMGQRANRDVINRTFGAASGCQRPPCPVANYY
jgi:hypothetical protein